MRKTRLTAAALAAVLLTALVGHNADAAVVPQLPGLIDRAGQPTSAYRSVISGWVVALNWADVEPAQGTIRRAAIDNAITAARAQGAGLKLRIYAGDNSPS